MATLTETFIEDGFADLGVLMPEEACRELMAAVRASRNFGSDIFLDQATFEADPQYRGTNPMPGRNLFEALSPKSDFILAEPRLKMALSELLGEDYTVLDQKFVCGVPDRWLPDWLKPRIIGNPVNNLGPYIRPAYRDITYFYGIDFHQDIIDWKSRYSDLITVYVYIHPVTAGDAPLYVLPKSHKLGACMFPHDLKKQPDGGWLYRNGTGGEMKLDERMLVGDTGYVACWHACTLHGTMPVSSDAERFSARFLISRGQAAKAGLDAVNATIPYPLSLEDTRRDLGDAGEAKIKGNIITGRPVGER